jgi:uncharacterized protein (DUF488 family)
MSPIYTIGYGARPIQALIDTLKTHHIAYLIDVRSAPYSRYKPEYSKHALAAELERQGIRYVFMGDQLGGRPDDPDCYVVGKVDYAQVKVKPFYQAGLARLRAAAAQEARVVLLCSEGKPEMCHRSKLIGASLEEMGIEVRHIDENDQLQSQDAVIARITGGQLGLFGPMEFTSRKRYVADDAAEEEGWGDDA